MNSEELARTLTPYMTFREYEAESTIATNLAKPRIVYYLQKGAVMVETQREEGDEIKQACMLKPPGSFIGVESMFQIQSNRGAQMSLTALLKSRVGAIEASKVSSLLTSELKEIKAEVSHGLAASLAESYVDLTKTAELWALAYPEDRVLHILEILLRTSSTPHQRGAVVSIATPKMASLIGLTEESARRGIRRLISRGKISKLGTGAYLFFNQP